MAIETRQDINHQNASFKPRTYLPSKIIKLKISDHCCLIHRQDAFKKKMQPWNNFVHFIQKNSMLVSGDYDEFKFSRIMNIFERKAIQNKTFVCIVYCYKWINRLSAQTWNSLSVIRFM